MNKPGSGHKRLFLFALYSGAGLLGRATFNYLGTLAKAGDIVLFSDCNLPQADVENLRAITIHAEAFRHGEYDFGSYKRGWQWACSNAAIQSYDYVYLVNDSVFCTTSDLTGLLEKLEDSGGDFLGMVFKPGHKGAHIQSWFVGLSRSMFLRPEFDSFLCGVRQECDKNDVCRRYETGLSNLAVSMGYHPQALFTIRGKGIYNHVCRNAREGLPFIKKASFVRHNCSLSAAINRAMSTVPRRTVDMIFDEVRQEYGQTLYERCLSSSRFKCAGRNIRYILQKSGLLL